MMICFDGEEVNNPVTRKIRKFIKLLRQGEFREILFRIRWNIREIVLIKTLRLIYRILPHNGVNVVEEDWNYLIILDACRYDMFKELNDIEGKLEKKISMGSSTQEWLKKNFTDYYDDIIYISSNPYISNYEVLKGFKGSDHFFKVEDVWDYAWNDELGTVLPEDVTKVALKMKEKYPHKRMIIHYMQPHEPFIGKTKLIPKNDTARERIRIWRNPKAKQAWKDNLKLVIKEVKKLIDKLDGRIVVTSDHGDCFGEKFILRHPEGIHVKELVEVPWLIIEKQKNYNNTEILRIKDKIKSLRKLGKI